MSRLLLVVPMLSVATPAHAFAVETVGGAEPSAGAVVKWFDAQVPIQLNSAGAPNISDGSDLAALRRAIDEWNSVSCSTLFLDERAPTSETDTTVTDGALDGVNRVTWVNDARWSFGSQVLGVTAPIYDTRDGEIVEADIAFNGRFSSWSTDGTANDIEAIATHELGHLIGLQHVLGGNALAEIPTMSPAAEIAMRTLTVDDASGACFLYPATPYRCSADCDCPTVVRTDTLGRENNVGQLSCDRGSCVPGGELGVGSGLGAPCIDQTSCTPPLFCQAIGQDAFCAQDCEPSDPSTCPEGSACFPYSNATGGACLPPDAGTDSGPNTDTICQANPPLTTLDPGPGGSSGSRPPPSPGRPAGPIDPCPCDVTTVCDGTECTCDPECLDGGCNAGLPPRGSSQALLALLILFAGRFSFRSLNEKRSRHVRSLQHRSRLGR